MRHHELKIDPGTLDPIIRGEKTFDVRRDDRDFAVGDDLTLRETVSSRLDMRVGGWPLEYTGREWKGRITHVLRGPNYGVQEGYSVLSIAPEEARGNLLRKVAENFSIENKEDGVWFILHGKGTTMRGAFNLGAQERIAVQAALALEEDRRAALDRMGDKDMDKKSWIAAIIEEARKDGYEMIGDTPESMWEDYGPDGLDLSPREALNRDYCEALPD